MSRRVHPRTIVGVLLFVPLAAAILMTFACLPAPIGDPNTAKVDAKLTGAWAPAGNDDKSILIITVRPWDEHTSYIQYLLTSKKEGEKGSVPNQVLNYKAWVTQLGGVNFIVCEALDDTEFLPQPANTPVEDRYYWVARYEVKDDTVTFREIKYNADIVAGLDTREKLEAAIKAHVNDDALYEAAKTLKKLSAADVKKIQDARMSLNLGMKKE